MPSVNYLGHSRASAASPTFTPSDGALLVVAVGGGISSAANEDVGTRIVLSGGGLTWTRRHTAGVVDSGGTWAKGMALFTAQVGLGEEMAVLAGLSSGAANSDVWTILVVEVTGHSEVNPVGALGANTDMPDPAASNAFSAALSAPTAEDSLVLGFLYGGHWDPVLTVGAGWTRLGERALTPAPYGDIAYRSGVVSSVDWSRADALSWNGGRHLIGIEILAEGGGGLEPITGVLAVAEPAEDIGAAGAARVSGSLSASEPLEAFAGSGLASIHAVVEGAEPLDEISSLARSAVAGRFEAVEAHEALAAVVSIADVAHHVIAEADEAISAFASVSVAGHHEAELTEGLAGEGTLHVRATLEIVESDEGLAASSGREFALTLDVIEEIETAQAYATVSVGAAGIAAIEGDEVFAAFAAARIAGRASVPEVGESLASRSGARVLADITSVELGEALHARLHLERVAELAVIEVGEMLVAGVAPLVPSRPPIIRSGARSLASIGTRVRGLSNITSRI